MSIENIINKIEKGVELDKEDLKGILSIKEPDDLTVLFDKAYEVKHKYVGNKAF